ncbi:flagellar biosynthesis anti-sigma factor FlgM [Oscillospiraceae bacterium PP1C4]
MNINPAAVHHIYKANSVPENGAGLKNDVSANSANTNVSGSEKHDTISISSEGFTQRDVSRIVKNVVNDMERMDSSSRAEEIKSAIENHTYFVSSSDLADAILGWAV